MVASYAEGRHEAAWSWRSIAPASYSMHRSAWKKNSTNFVTTEFSEVGLRVRTTHCVALSTLIFATVKNNMRLSSLEVEGVIIHVGHDALSQT